MLLWAVIALFVLMVVSVIASWFFGTPVMVPWNQPAPNQGRFFQAVYFLIGVILIINFALCCYGPGEHAILPPLIRGG
jgi:hypothetical protein